MLGKIMPSPTMILTSITCDMLGYMAKEIKDASGIKFANQLTLRWGEYPGYARWAQSKLDKLDKAKKWIMS